MHPNVNVIKASFGYCVALLVQSNKIDHILLVHAALSIEDQLFFYSIKLLALYEIG